MLAGQPPRRHRLFIFSLPSPRLRCRQPSNAAPMTGCGQTDGVGGDGEIESGGNVFAKFATKLDFPVANFSLRRRDRCPRTVGI